jgi:hypothetical protein
MVREPPNILNWYSIVIPQTFAECQQVLTSNYYSVDKELVDFATKNETWTECLQFSNNKREIELEAYQDFLDNYLVAAIAARHLCYRGC